MKRASDAGKKGAKRNLAKYRGLQQTKASSKGGLVTWLRHGSEWRSQVVKAYYAKMTPEQRRKHTEKARKVRAKNDAERKRQNGG